MKGDFTRNTFQREKHYSGVRMQQGRVQLDADWNEQIDIAAHHVATGVIDSIGNAGAPKHQAAFGIVDPATLDTNTTERLTEARLLPLPPGDLLFSPGRFYADGTLCEVEDYFRLSRQSDFPGAATISKEGPHLLYLDVWQRHLTALDDVAIREKALGGPDTATRTKTVWQVKTKAVTQAGCVSDPADWAKLNIFTPSTGKLAARGQTDKVPDGPCLLPPSAGYRRLENQLYRVEIHQPGGLGEAKFKWSRDNGTVVTRVSSLNADIATVEDLGRDSVLGFNNGDWVELTDDARELNGDKGVLIEISIINRTKHEVQFTAAPDFKFDPKLNPKMRRWDDPAGERDLMQGTDSDGFLDLEGGVQVKFTAGHYNTGDYWLIPARTAEHAVEWPVKDADGNVVPVEQPPLGITHALACLAVVEAKLDDEEKIILAEVEDCRKVFPPLTEVEDPKEAHKRHNRHLHGWGVVCGLQVHCGQTRRSVQIESGYALQCDGSEILLPSPGRPFEVVDAARAVGLLKDNAGKVRVTLAADADDITFGVRAPADEKDKSFLERLLAGTFWMDVFNDCIKPFVDFVKKQFSADDPRDTRLVKASARRLIAAFNLGVQFVNPTETAHIFLSREEHDLLKDLHDGLKDLLGKCDPAYCAIFDGLPVFPEYPFQEAGVLTGFGREAMTQIRLAPNGRVAYAFGRVGGTKVAVFDLARTRGETPCCELTAEIELSAPAGAGELQVVDLVFRTRDRLLLVAAVTSNGNSVLYRYKVKISKEGTQYDQDGEPVVVPEQRVLRIGEMTGDTTHLYSLVKEVGLVRFNPLDFGADDFSNALVAFKPTGHWASGEDVFPGMIFAVGTSGAGANAEVNPREFPPVCVIRVSGRAAIVATIPLDGSCSDGLAFLFTRTEATPTDATTDKRARVDPRLYVVLDPKTPTQNKRLLVIRPPRGNISHQLLAEVDLETRDDVRLTATADDQFMLVTLANLGQLRWFDPATNKWVTEQTLPTQIHPVAVAASQAAVIVVNRESHTLSRIPAGLLTKPGSITMDAVATYRLSLVKLARELGLRLLQHLKDCVCEHLVQNCPTCGSDDLIDLACVEIRESKVYHIANCCRREVVTFPKLKYWLSTVPILPLVTWAVREFCGLVLPDLFKPKEISVFRPGTAATKPLAAVGTLGVIRERLTVSQFKLVRQNLAARVGQISKHFAAAAKVEAIAPFKPDIAVRAQELMDSDEEIVKRRLTDSGVQVKSVADYDETMAGRPWGSLSNMRFDFIPGDEVDLLVKEGKVVMITTAKPASADQAAASTAELVKEVDRLNTRLADMRTEHVAYLAAREKEMNAVKADLEKFNTILSARSTPTPRVAKPVSKRKPK